MTCNAIATRMGRVSLAWELDQEDQIDLPEVVLNVLEADQLQKLIQAYLTKTFQSCSPYPNQQWSTPDFVFQLSGKKLKAVRQYASQKSVVDRKKALAGLGNFIQQAAGIALQAKVKKTIQAMGRIETEQRLPNGAIVLTVEI